MDKTDFIKKWWESADDVTLITRPRRFGKTLNMSMLDMLDSMAAASLRALSDFLGRYYEKKVIILLDEYDTPIQEAYVNGYWKELVTFARGLFNSTFKTNPYLERAIMTGITRVSKESIFSDLNNLEVITTTSKKYADCFGFSEEEVFAALEEYGLSDQKNLVKDWYDGFSFGEEKDIYNPWSIINFLDKKEAGAYWANTSANSLVEKLLRGSRPKVKQAFERLLAGGILNLEIDEQIIYDQLFTKKNAIFSLLLASGYLKVVSRQFVNKTGRIYYDLALTNREVQIMFENMIQDWFSGNDDYNDFIKALLSGDLAAMNTYMNKVTAEMFSFFDTTEQSLSDTVRNALRQIEERNYKAALTAKGFSEEHIQKYGFAFCGKKVLIGSASTDCLPDEH